MSLFPLPKVPRPRIKLLLKRGQPVLFGTNVDVQSSSSTGNVELGLGTHQEDKPAVKKKKRRGEFAIAPVPLVNPSIGNGGGLAAIYAVPLGNESSPPSTFGAGGVGTGTGSWILGLGARLHLQDDKYRITVAGGGGQINYNYFGIGTAAGAAGKSIPLAQRSSAILIEPKIRVYRRWYVGPRYHWISSDTSLNSTELNPDDLPAPLPGDLNLRTAAFGGRVQRDTSDSTFYPLRGSILDILADLYGSAVGGRRTYQNLTLGYNKYLSLGSKSVIAVRGSDCMVTEAAPFYDICTLGFCEGSSRLPDRAVS